MCNVIAYNKLPFMVGKEPVNHASDHVCVCVKNIVHHLVMRRKVVIGEISVDG